jgi:enoyl-CoA hydratase/carnithine racemase
MSYQQIVTGLADSVMTITLNRPDQLNAWTPTMQQELIAAFDEADGNDAVRVVIVTGAGRGFCAGADLAAGGATFDRRDRGSSHAVPATAGGSSRFACLTAPSR